MKKAHSIVSILMLAIVIFSQNAVPVNAATPTFDVSGVWKLPIGDTFQMFQEKDEVNGIYINTGFSHRWSGRYISPTKMKLVQIRRTRANNCEVTMEIEITVVSANSITMTSTAPEGGCGISQGQVFPPGIATRVI